MDRNVRAGFAAQAAFEVIGAAEVPNALNLTFPVDTDPDALSIDSPALDHLDRVSMSWPQAETAMPFVFDLYVHGPKEEGGLAIKVPGFDIRKFLHQSVVAVSADRDLARTQAQLAEFSRKAKVIYRGARDDALAYDRRTSDRVIRAIEPLLAGRPPGGAPPLERASAALAATPPNLAVAHRNLSLAISDRAAASAEKRASLESLASSVLSADVSRKIASVKITNNCREPGNYEVEIRDGLGRPLIRSNFAFDPDTYDAILERFHGIGIWDQGTGLRIPESIRAQGDGKYNAAALPWNQVKSFPSASLGSLDPLRPNGPARVYRGEIRVARGRIPFEDYEIEVRRKSAFRRPHSEPLSFVRVDPSLPMPRGFKAPDHGGPSEYWTAPENAGKVVAHRYSFFEDLRTYALFFSGFEANGVYIGRSDLEDFDKERRVGRWAFDLSHLQDLSRFEIRVYGETPNAPETLEVHLLGSSVNYVIGNLRLTGEAVDLLLGIGAQPLIADYNDNVFQAPISFALAFADDGQLLDHHRFDIGVERVYVERVSARSLRLRLISFERIVPVWEGMLEYR